LHVRHAHTNMRAFLGLLLIAAAHGLNIGSSIHQNAVQQRSMPVTLQFGSALDALNNDMNDDLKEAKGDEEDRPMTKAELRAEAKAAEAELKALKAEAAAAAKKAAE